MDDVHPQVANVSHALHPESVTLNEASHIPILMVSEDFGGWAKVRFVKKCAKCCETRGCENEKNHQIFAPFYPMKPRNSKKATSCSSKISVSAVFFRVKWLPPGGLHAADGRQRSTTVDKTSSSCSSKTRVNAVFFRVKWLLPGHLLLRTLDNTRQKLQNVEFAQ